MTTLAESPVRDAYDALAPAYDELTRYYPYERWLRALESLALEHGLRGNRLLDVACGTGKSFLPLLERGYEVVACDMAPEMAVRAASKDPRAHVVVADMRELEVLGEFDLLTCLDDSVNYLLDSDEVIATLCGFRRNLAAGGLAIWDVNSLAMYRTTFATDWISDGDDTYLAWRGLAGATFAEGGRTGAQVDVFVRDEDRWQRTTSVHTQRHWPVAAMVELAAKAGLEIIDVQGQHRGATLDPWADEQLHTKIVFVARRNDNATSERG